VANVIWPLMAMAACLHLCREIDCQAGDRKGAKSGDRIHDSREIQRAAQLN
jgi:hypothetical protein